jgi:hypothetical protein
MFRVDHVSGITTLEPPTAPITNLGLYFTGGDPGVGGTGVIPATVVEPEWLNMIQEELCNLVAAAEENLDKSDRAQIARCIYKISHPGGGGPIGPSMYEPPDTGTPYARAYDGTVGRWEPSILEPEDDGRAYARVWAQGAPAGRWEIVAGQGRAIGDMDFYVERDGDNDNDGMTPATAWADIQYAVDAVCDRLDAGGFIITINVGDDGGTPWPGFAVTQPLLNAPAQGFRVIGSSSTGATRQNCRLAACEKPGYEGYGIYANNTRVSVGHFTFQTSVSMVPHSGARVYAEGCDTTLWIEEEICFYPDRSNNPLIFAKEGAHIIIDRQPGGANSVIVVSGAYSPNAGSAIGDPNADATYKGLIAADETAQIIFEDSRNGEFGITKPRAELFIEGAAMAGRALYANRGSVIHFGDEGIVLPRTPASYLGSAVGMYAASVITAGPRGVMTNTRSGATLPSLYYGMISTGDYSAGSGKLWGASVRNYTAEQWTSGSQTTPANAPP